MTAFKGVGLQRFLYVAWLSLVYCTPYLDAVDGGRSPICFKKLCCGKLVCSVIKAVPMVFGIILSLPQGQTTLDSDCSVACCARNCPVQCWLKGLELPAFSCGYHVGVLQKSCNWLRTTRSSISDGGLPHRLPRHTRLKYWSGSLSNHYLHIKIRSSNYTYRQFPTDRTLLSECCKGFLSLTSAQWILTENNPSFLRNWSLILRRVVKKPHICPFMDDICVTFQLERW